MRLISVPKAVLAAVFPKTATHLRRKNRLPAQPNTPLTEREKAVLAEVGIGLRSPVGPSETTMTVADLPFRRRLRHEMFYTRPMPFM